MFYGKLKKFAGLIADIVGSKGVGDREILQRRLKSWVEKYLKW